MRFIKRIASLSLIYFILGLTGIFFLFIVIGIVKLNPVILIMAIFTWGLMIGMLFLSKILGLLVESSLGARKRQNVPVVAEAIISIGLPQRYKEEALMEIYEQYLEILSNKGLGAAKQYYWFEASAASLDIIRSPILIIGNMMSNSLLREKQHQKRTN